MALRIDRLLRAAALALLCLLISLGPALAHAELVRSDPADGAALKQAPEQVRLWFSEQLVPAFSQARLLDAGGQVIAGAQSHVDLADPSLLVIALPPLGDGIYSVAFGVLSAEDGHAWAGHITFTVGAAVAQPGAGPAGAGRALPAPPEVVLRWLHLLALTSMAGALAVAFLVLSPRPEEGAPADAASLDASSGASLAPRFTSAQRRVLLAAAACSLAATAAGAGLLAWQAAKLLPAAGSAPASGTPSFLGVFLGLATATRGGQLWIQREVLLAVIAAVIFAELRAAKGQRVAGASAWALGVLAAAALATQALASHAAALPSASYPAVAADLLHLAGASLWAGGLLSLAITLLPLAGQQRETSTAAMLLRRAWRPFGSLAALGVGLLATSGLYSMGREIASPDAGLTTIYGQAVLVKSALFLAMGAIGLLNSSLLHPGVAGPLAALLRRPAGWTPLSLKRLPMLITVEAGLALLAILATGVMTAATPPHGTQYAPTAEAEAMRPLTEQAQDLMVTFRADPNRAGSNTFTVDVAPHQGALGEILRVILRFSYLDEDLGMVSADASPTGLPGQYRLVGTQTALAGLWQADVVVRRGGVEDVTTRFQWSVAPPPAAVLVSDRPLAPVLTPIAWGGLAAVLLVTAAAWLRRERRARERTGGEAVER